MIVAMKKISLVVQQKDAADTVAALRALGVVHVEHQRLPAGEDVEACGRDLELLDQALRVLSEDVFSKGARKPAAEEAADWRRAALHAIDAAKRYEHLEEFAHQMKGLAGVGRLRSRGGQGLEGARRLRASLRRAGQRGGAVSR